ncbi:hypothetical protein MY3296_008149 [Beauveria thailandica]
MSSTVFPSDAFTRPPTKPPQRSLSVSDASEISPDSGMMARKLKRKSAMGFHEYAEATKPRGAHTSSRFRLRYLRTWRGKPKRGILTAQAWLRTD